MKGQRGRREWAHDLRGDDDRLQGKALCKRKARDRQQGGGQEHARQVTVACDNNDWIIEEGEKATDRATTQPGPYRKTHWLLSR